MSENTIILGSDHAGYPLKQKCLSYLQDCGYKVEDLGTHSTESCDYPEFAAKVCTRVLKTKSLGLLTCGTGLGMSMTANRFTNIRAALCTNEYQASMARRHNNANILCLGARVLGDDLALSIMDTFIKSEFEGGRHQKRIQLMDTIS